MEMLLAVIAALLSALFGRKAPPAAPNASGDASGAPAAADSPTPQDAPSGAPAGSDGPDGIPDDYWPLLARIESGNRPYIKAAASSGSGLYQFVKATWIAEGGQWGDDPSLAFGGLRPTPDEQLARAKSFTAKNAAYLRRKGIPINKASLYAAHFFGPVTAAAVIAADVNARADLIAGAPATSANPSILRDKTVGEFLTWLHGKTGDWAR